MDAPAERLIGLMSGSSLDGLDIVAADFWKDEGKWTYQIIAGETVSYPAVWIKRLKNAHKLSSREIIKIDRDFGRLCGLQVNQFIAKNKLKQINAIASHGHTVFHDTAQKINLQIGYGGELAHQTGISVVSDFRSQDILKGGQGAPLVAVGDALLFGAYDACLNLGGIANISFNDSSGLRRAYDVCPANQVLNDLAAKAGKNFDNFGCMARSGSMIPELFQKLNKIDYYANSYPKSISNEWVASEVLPFFLSERIISDALRTATEHIAWQISRVLLKENIRSVLSTGGGSFNTFLIERIRHFSECSLTIPGPDVVNFKEALIFAFLGLRRLKNKTNVWASVTGAEHNSSSGAVFMP